jgi:hypothetical protein
MEIMKKYMLIIIFVIGFCLNLNAQMSSQGYTGNTDGFFSTDQYNEYDRGNQWAGGMPMLPRVHDSKSDESAKDTPLSSGFLILASMGIGYAVVRRKKKENQY